MATVIYKGFYTALTAGQLSGTPDIRFLIAMTGFTFDEDSVNLDDGTLDEFDGSNYARYDAANPTGGYIDADDLFKLDCDGGDFGTSPSGAGTDDSAYLVCYRHVDGTAANDIILFSTDVGVPPSIHGGAITLVVPAEGVLLVRTAD